MNNDSKQDVITRLKALKKEMAVRYRVKGLELFGSVAREEHKEVSDIDILVEFEDGADLFDLVGLGLFLEEKLKRKVDVVPKRSLRAELRSSVLTEAVAI